MTSDCSSSRSCALLEKTRTSMLKIVQCPTKASLFKNYFKPEFDTAIINITTRKYWKFNVYNRAVASIVFQKKGRTLWQAEWWKGGRVGCIEWFLLIFWFFVYLIALCTPRSTGLPTPVSPLTNLIITMTAPHPFPPTWKLSHNFKIAKYNYCTKSCNN